MKSNPQIILGVLVCTLLVGCGKSESTTQQSARPAIQPAVKLTNDATAVAQEAWVLLNQLDQIVYAGDLQNIDETVRKPLRELTLRWKTEVKMTDSVTEGKYALCRKALNSLDVWVRMLKEQKNPAQAKADYERDKALCKNAIEHPEMGNTSPKELAERQS